MNASQMADFCLSLWKVKPQAGTTSPPPPKYTRLFPRFATLQRNFYTYTAKGQTLMGQSKQFYNIQQRPNESPVHPLIPSIIP